MCYQHYYSFRKLTLCFILATTTSGDGSIAEEEEVDEGIENDDAASNSGGHYFDDNDASGVQDGDYDVQSTAAEATTSSDAADSSIANTSSIVKLIKKKYHHKMEDIDALFVTVLVNSRSPEEIAEAVLASPNRDRIISCINAGMPDDTHHTSPSTTSKKTAAVRRTTADVRAKSPVPAPDTTPVRTSRFGRIQVPIQPLQYDKLGNSNTYGGGSGTQTVVMTQMAPVVTPATPAKTRGRPPKNAAKAVVQQIMTDEDAVQVSKMAHEKAKQDRAHERWVNEVRREESIAASMQDDDRDDTLPASPRFFSTIQLVLRWLLMEIEMIKLVLMWLLMEMEMMTMEITTMVESMKTVSPNTKSWSTSTVSEPGSSISGRRRKSLTRTRSLVVQMKTVTRKASSSTSMVCEVGSRTSVRRTRSNHQTTRSLVVPTRAVPLLLIRMKSK